MSISCFSDTNNKCHILKDVNKPDVIYPTSSPLISQTSFKWLENSCWADSMLIALFKLPGTWFEKFIRDSEVIRLFISPQNINQVCSYDDAKHIHEALLQDIYNLQSNKPNEECISRKLFFNCTKMYQKGRLIGDFASALAFLQALAYIYGITDQILFDENIVLLDENLVTTDISLPVFKEIIVTKNFPKMLVFSHELQYATPHFQIIPMKSPPPNKIRIFRGGESKEYILSSAIVYRNGHFMSMVKDPRTEEWWFFDSKAKTSYLDQFGNENNMFPDAYPVRNLGKNPTILQSPVKMRVVNLYPSDTLKAYQIMSDSMLTHYVNVFIYQDEEDINIIKYSTKEEKQIISPINKFQIPQTLTGQLNSITEPLTFKIFVKLIQLAELEKGFDSFINGPNKIIILIPPDSYFQSLPEGNLQHLFSLDKHILLDIVKFHVIYKTEMIQGGLILYNLAMRQSLFANNYVDEIPVINKNIKIGEYVIIMPVNGILGYKIP